MPQHLTDDFTHPMTTEEFRRHGYALIDLIADYHADFPTPVAPTTLKPGELLGVLPATPPIEPEPFEKVVDDLRQQILPALTHWLSPSFFAFFPCNSSFPAILGELMSAGLGQQGMMWLTSPACTELEMSTLDWLAQALQLPSDFTHAGGQGGGVIHGTASEAILTALVAARHRALARLDAIDDAKVGSRMVVYGSDQTHSSLLKACRIAGFQASQLRLITTKDGSILAATLAAAVAEDLAAGRLPLFVCGTVGTTSSASIDPIRKLGELCQNHEIWLHVDAAYAGSACICPEFRPLIDGVELADSFNFNPHKWMLVTFDCSAFFVRDKIALTKSLSVTPEYLRNEATESGAATDFRDWQIPLGRRFRALKLWFVMRSYGLSGLQEFIRHGVALAEHFEQWLTTSEPRLQLASPRSLALVCFRVRDNGKREAKIDARTKELMERVNATGQVFLTHTSLLGRYTIRASFAGQYTQLSHVKQLQHLISSELDKI